MVQVIDAPCGAGKTTWAINTINAHPEQSFIYCTPFLDEIERIRENCGKDRFEEPNNYGTSKIEDFNRILLDGKDIAVTHSTFLNATEETLDLIEKGKYTLIIDEALDVIQDFNSLNFVEKDVRQTMTRADVRILVDNGLIEITKPMGRVKWLYNNVDSEEDKFYEVRRLALLNRLYCVREQMFVCVFPPEMFDCFDRVYCMTYLFNGSVLKPYFELFNISYEMKTISNGTIQDFDENYDLAFRQECKKLIHLHNTKIEYRGPALSKSWYMRNSKSKDEMNGIKNKIRYFVEKKHKNGNIMWTCPKEYYDKLRYRSYGLTRQLTEEERNLTDEQKEYLLKKISCFVPCNAKATNDYSNRDTLVYCCNMYQNTMIQGFFEDCGIETNDDMFALSCLVQWIFRSRIRNHQPIQLYILSNRMKNILTNWLR